MKKERILISLGGSLIAPNGVDVSFLKKFRKCILECVQKGVHFVIVCGGGKICRDYQSAAQRVLEISPTQRDWIGIFATRLNGRLVQAIFSEYTHPEMIGNPNTYVKISKPIAVTAGWRPGCSTDNDAVLLAHRLGIRRVLNASVIDYAYTDDPQKNPQAKPIKNISWKEFRVLIPKKWTPGSHTPFDPIASKKAEKYRMEVVILNGRKIQNLKNCILRKKFFGTRIGSEQ